MDSIHNNEDPIVTMTRKQYDDQAAAARKELKRLRKEVAKLRDELQTAILDHKIAIGYEKTIHQQMNI